MQGTRYHLRKQQFGCMTRRHKTRLVAVHAVACRDILMTVAFKATWKLDPEHVVKAWQKNLLVSEASWNDALDASVSRSLVAEHRIATEPGGLWYW